MKGYAERPPRPLTSDETKAAEAAFTGRPFQLGWSEAAWHVYEAIRLVLMAQGRVQINGLRKD